MRFDNLARESENPALAQAESDPDGALQRLGRHQGTYMSDQANIKNTIPATQSTVAPAPTPFAMLLE
jgi:hypothetical protein